MLVAAHKQIQTAFDDVEQQAFIGAHAFRAKAFVKVQVKLHGRQLGAAALAAGQAFVGALRQQVQLQPVFGLQVDDQPVGRARRRAENRVRCRPEVDHDACIPRRQAFAGAYVKRHAGPAPVGDFSAQGHKGFGLAVGRYAGLVRVRRHRCAVAAAADVLAAHHVLLQGLWGPGFEGAQDLELFVANRVGVGVDGRLHADGAEQLQGVVLHHVAQRAGVVVKSAALFNAQVFRHGDLDVGNVLATPQGLKQRIAKAQCKQVLYRGFAEVMVDTEHLLFAEHAAHGFVDGAVGGQVMAQRLFKHHAGGRAVQPGSGDLLDHRREQAGRCGHVHDHGVCLAGFDHLSEPGEVGGLCDVQAQEVEHGRKACKFFLTRALVEFHFIKAGFDEGPVGVVRQVVTRYADDASAGGQGAVAKSLKQSRHQFAPGQIASAAK